MPPAPARHAPTTDIDPDLRTCPRAAEESGEHRRVEPIFEEGDADPFYEVTGFERYDASKMLGEGGMGEVHLCLDRRIQRAVAMKKMRAERADSPADRVRFMREAMAQARLEHPSIVPVYDFGTDSRGGLFFTMRRVQGLTMDEVLQGLRDNDPKISAEYTRHRMLSAFASVCLAVHYAHTRNVFHCDIKPANIMVGAFGEVYVLDWGVAETESSANFGGGTPGYMAPEQIRQETIDARTDVYALGATLFEILTLERLHDGDSVTAARKTLTHDVQVPSAAAPHREIAPELDAICAKATALDPMDRYADVRALHADLERYLAGDRDLSLRKSMSRAHAEAAAFHLSRLREGEGSLGVRKEALRAVGRALVFDPENLSALRTLAQLVTEMPNEMPPEVEAELHVAERAFQRTRAVAGALGFFAWLALLPLFYLFGVAEGWAIGLNAAVWSLAGAALLAVAKRPTRDGRSSVAVPILGGVATALTAPVLGSLWLTATFATVITMGFTLAMRPRDRFVPLIAGVLSVFVPWMLAVTDVLPASMVFGGSAGALNDAATYLGFASSLICIFVASFFGIKLREKLTEVHQRACLNTWQLRQLVPIAKV